MTLSSKDRQELRQFIVTFFNDQELRTLCFDISVDFDSLSGDGKDAKARELINHAERRILVKELLVYLRAQRPGAFQTLKSESLIAIVKDYPDPKLPKLLGNPYAYGPFVTDPNMFFGRVPELNSLCARLRNMQSVSVTGVRRIGKSSLLYRLAQTLRDELGSSYTPLFINLHDARYRTVEDFAQTTIRTLNEQMGGILAVNSVTNMYTFSEMIERLNRAGVHPILCLDEFEEFMQHPEEFNDDFLEGLRALGTSGQLAMVTASRISLADLIQTFGLTSPFFNVFSQVELGLLESDAAQSLRRIPFEKKGLTLSSEDEALIDELAGRHPFFLQMACYHLYEAWSESPDNRATLVRERFEREAEPHFKRLWEHSDSAEQAALSMIVGQAVPTEETASTFKRLARLGVVEETDGDWRIFSQTFARQVQKYPAPTLSNSGPEKTVGEDKGPLPPNGIQFLLFAGVATAVIVIAALISLLLPEQRIRPTLIITALVLLFGLIGAGKLTGYDFLQALGRLIGLGK